MGKARDGREFNELEVMTTANGSNLKLNDLAWVKDGFEDKVLYTEFSDEPAVTLGFSGWEIRVHWIFQKR